MHKERIIKWNRERGLLPEFDPALHLKHLSQEAQEFYMAETLAHKLAEYSDFMFFLEGIKARWGCVVFTSTYDFEVQHKGFNMLLDWADDKLSFMQEVLEDMLAAQGKITLLSKALHIAMTVVCECNELKPKKTVNGKIVKGDKHVDPVNEIRKRLLSEGVKA